MTFGYSGMFLGMRKGNCIQGVKDRTRPINNISNNNKNNGHRAIKDNAWTFILDLISHFASQWPKNTLKVC